jgi:hypothetical protein
MNKTEVVKIRLSKSEKSILQERAKELNMTMSRYTRCFGIPIKNK